MTPNLEYIALDDKLYAYVNAHHSGHDPLLDDLRRETAALGSVITMQISADEGALMTLLCRAISARRAIEVGTFTGMSSLCLARGLADDGHLLCCDISPEWTAVARRYWERAGVHHKIELQLGPALATLRALPPDPVVDVSFIDADKANYGAYYEEILLRTRPGGLILLDNVLWSGRIIDPAAQDEDTVALRQVNDLIAGDRRVDSVMLPVRDGLTIARKR